MDGGVCDLVHFLLDGDGYRGLCYPAKSEAIVLEAIAKNNTKARPENVYDCANKNGVSLKVKLIVGLV